MSQTDARHELIEAAKKEALERFTGEPIAIVSCVGPPDCLLEGADALRAIHAGCTRCERYTVGGSGSGRA